MDKAKIENRDGVNPLTLKPFGIDPTARISAEDVRNDQPKASQDLKHMRPQVRAKFKCTSVTETEGGMKTASMQPVVNGSEENKRFFQYTPSGQIQLGVMNADASKHFVPGREYYVDFTEAS